MLRPHHISFACVLSLVFVGCGAASAVTPDPSAANAKTITDGAAPAPFAEGSAARVVPDTAVAALLVANPSALFAALQRDVLAARYPEVDHAIAETLTHWLGVDVTQAGQLRTVGVDPERPGGFAVLDVAMRNAVVFATMADRATLVAALQAGTEAKGGRLTEKVEGDATIFFVDRVDSSRRAWFILRDDVAMLLLCSTTDDVGWAYARQLATLPADDSLEQDAGMRAALGGLESTTAVQGRAALVVLNIARLARQEVADIDEQTRRLTEEVREAHTRCMRDRPQDDPRCEALYEVQWQASYLPRLKASRELLQKVLLPAQGMALGLEVGGHGARLPGFIAMHEDALMTKVFVPGGGASTIASAPRAKPALLMQGSIDTARALELLELLMRADGTSLAEATSELTERLGMDPVAELIPLLDGEAGLAIELDMEAVKAGRDDDMAIFHAVAGLKDAAATRALLARIFGHPLLAVFVHATKQEGRWIAYIPRWQQVHIAVTDHLLIVANDAETADRVLAANGAPAWASSPTHGELLTKRGTVGMWQYDSSLFLLFFSRGSNGYNPEFYDPSPGAAWSQASRAKQEELEALDAAQRSTRQAHEAQELAHVERLVELLGAWIVTAELAEGGVALDGGLMLSSSDVAATIGDIVQTFQALEADSDASREAERGNDELRGSLLQELEELRYQDAASPNVGP